MTKKGGLTRVGEVPIYAQDPLVRRAEALQQTHEVVAAAIRVNPAVAKKAGLEAGQQAVVEQEGNRVSLPLEIDTSLPDGCVRVSAALAGTEELGGQFAEVTLEKA